MSIRKHLIKEKADLAAFYLRDKTSTAECSVEERQLISIENEWRSEAVKTNLKAKIAEFLASDEYKNARSLKKFRYVLKYRVMLDRRGQIVLPDREIAALACTFLPDILAFFESEEGKAEFEKWKAERDAALKAQKVVKVQKEAS